MNAEAVPLRAVPAPDAGTETSPGKQKFIVGDCAAEIASTEPYATGGAQLYVFTDGCYRPGERHLHRRIVELLGDSWSRRKSEEIVTYLRITSPELWEQPPVGTINVTNGLLDVETRELKPHTRDHLSPVQITAAYDPNAGCPAIEAFMQSTIPELTALFTEIVGYILTPDNRLQRAIMLMGPGGTGKSTAANVLRALLGHENVSAVALHQLEEDRFATADLYGRLANVFADLPAHALKSSSIFKSITGGDRIRAERKHRAAFDFTPYARLIFSANDAPPTTDSSDAFFDRWLILPFDRRHRGTSHQDHDLLAKLTRPQELSGLLNLGLDGLDRLRQQHGFSRAANSDHAAERFRVDADSAAGFCEECANITQEARTAKTALFQSYRAWCEENNRRPLAAQRFNRRLRELHNLDEVASKGRDYWLGIELREEEP
ncbi:MAG: phage/plasmid primase, P4 family [Solirubrobacteraceae bacterium]